MKQTKKSICPPILVGLIPINYVFHLFWASRHEVCEGACRAFLVMLCELGDFYCAVLQSVAILLFLNALASWSREVYFPISIPNWICFLGDAIPRLTLKTGNALCLQTDCLVSCLSDPRETFPGHLDIDAAEDKLPYSLFLSLSLQFLWCFIFTPQCLETIVYVK